MDALAISFFRNTKECFHKFKIYLNSLVFFVLKNLIVKIISIYIIIHIIIEFEIYNLSELH